MSVGIKTTQDAKFYAVSAAFEKFSNEGKTVVVQFTVKHEQRIDCGGGYVKVRGWMSAHVCVCVCVSVSAYIMWVGLWMYICMYVLVSGSQWCVCVCFE